MLFRGDGNDGPYVVIDRTRRNFPTGVDGIGATWLKTDKWTRVVDVTDEGIELLSSAKREELSFGHNEARVGLINAWDRHQDFERSGIHVHFELHQFLLLVIL